MERRRHRANQALTLSLQTWWRVVVHTLPVFQKLQRIVDYERRHWNVNLILSY